MTGKNMSTLAVGAVLSAAAGTAAYMAMKNNQNGAGNMKKLKKNTGKALKTVGGIVTDLSDIIG